MKVFPKTLLALLILTASPYFLSAQDLIIEDAERFASLFLSHPDSLSAEVLQEGYLDKGTLGIQIFTPNRIKNAENLAKRIYARRDWYEKAVTLAIPAIREMRGEAQETLSSVQNVLKQKSGAPIYMVFGAGNSGGTASGKGLVVGLEVITRFVQTQEEAKELIRYFIAHEVVHVYQFREKTRAGRSLLGQSLREGFGDFVASLILGGIAQSEVERHEYGLKHEKELWVEFQKVMQEKELRPWMYGKPKDGKPADLGYWIGKRICEAYYARATDKEAALQELLKLKDINQILEQSGYNPQ